MQQQGAGWHHYIMTVLRHALCTLPFRSAPVKLRKNMFSVVKAGTGIRNKIDFDNEFQFL